jgi:amino acid adenylation domain-containing protein
MNSREGTFGTRAPASRSQARFWALEKLGSETVTANAWRFWELDGALDMRALERACNALIGRHELLRTRFVLSGDELLQEVMRHDSPLELASTDLRGAPDAEQRALKDASRAVAVGLDLGRAPLWRVHVWRVAEERAYLLLLSHHTVCDGWSWTVLHRELGALYDQEAHGIAASLPGIARSFRDFAAHERERLRSPELTAKLARMREDLRGVPDLDLPRDRASAGRESARHHFTIPEALGTRLAALARSSGTTAFAAWLALFALALGRHCRQQDFALGIAAANRADRACAALVGPLATLAPVRMRLASAGSFSELLAQAAQARAYVHAHEDVPFEWLTQELGSRYQAGKVSMVQAMLSYRNLPDAGLPMRGVRATAKPLDVACESTDFDLILEISPEKEQTRACFVYRAQAFQQESVALMAERLVRLGSEVCDDPGRPLAAYPALGHREERLILHQWAGATRLEPRELTVTEAFARQARLRPGAVALLAAGRSVRYGELDAMSERMRAHLAARGVRGGTFVGVLHGPGVEFIATLLGILKAGAGYLPLDPRDPLERLQMLLAQAGCRVVVGPAQCRDRLPEGITFLCGEELLEAPPAPGAPGARPSAESPAYVMFTSGSTGMPKGVVAPHRGIVRLVVDAAWADLRPEDVFLLQSAASFDGATFEIWGALLNGGCLVIPDARLQSTHEIRETLRRHGVTVLFLTTSVYNMLAGEDVTCLAGVRLLVVGGEAMNPARTKRGLAHLHGCRIVNGYGPTENTTFTCTHPVTLVEAGRSIPIGRPIDRTCVYILDDEQNAVPVGTRGELCTGGEGLALGYLGQPALTDERFVEMPAAKLGRDDGAAVRLYRTGDLARWRPDGLVEFLGRADRQVKRRGFRIEPAEIESVLLHCPGIRHAAVRLWDGEEGGKLVAYVVRSGGRHDPAALRAWAQERLPGWMVPDHFVLLDELPLRQTGKIDLDALPAPQISQTRRDTRPMSRVEQRVAGVMASVLSCASIGADQDFFQLGGDSLRAIQFLGRLERELGKRITAADFLRQPTVEHAARLLSRPAEALPPEIEVLRRGASATAIFFAHSIGGHSFYARAYLPYLPQTDAVYGLRAPDSEAACMASLEALASHYANAIQAVQKSGPYHLAGYSFGAHLAFEIARQLAARGERIGVLAIIDSTPQAEPGELHIDAHPAGTVEAVTKTQLAGYRHEPLDARVLLFRSESRADEPLLLPDGGWGALALGGVETVRFPGDHAAARREPAARLIGERIARALTDPPRDRSDCPGGKPAPWVLAALWLAQGADKRARLALYRDRVREGTPLPPWALVDYVALCEELDCSSQAEALLCDLEAKTSPPPGIAFALGIARERQGRPRDAAQSFKRAAAASTGQPAPLLHLSRLAVQAGDTEAAIAYARDAAAGAPHSTLARRTLATLLLEAGRSIESLRELDAAIACDDGDPELRALRSRVLAQTRSARFL